MNVFLLTVSLITRLIFLFFDMPSITHDEADFYTNSFILAKTGTDISGNKLFLTTGIDNIDGSIPIYLGSFLFNFFDKNILIARLPYAILNSLTPLLFYLIILKITKNKTLSFLSFFIFNFSPFFLHMASQGGLGSTFSLLFFLLAYFSYLKVEKKFWKNLLFFAFLFFSFNSYMGIKIIFPFLVLIIFQTEVLIKNKDLFFQKITPNLIKSIFIFLIFLIPLFFNHDGQLFNKRAKDEIIPLNKEYLENIVWYERLTSINNSLLKKIFSNKLTVITNQFLIRYFEAFNLKYLFLTGDPHPIYGVNIYGLFYLWQIIFFIIGFIISFSSLPLKINLIFIFLLLISPIGLSLSKNSPTVVLRAMPIFLSYIFYIALGVDYIAKYLKNKFNLKKNISYFFIIFLTILSFVHFFLIYQVRIKILSSEQWHLNEKKLFEKILNEEKLKNKKIYILNNDPKPTFLLFSFYHINDAYLIKNKLNNKDYFFKNIYFSNLCPEKINDKNSLFIIKREHCKIEENYKLLNKKILSVFLEAEDKSGPIYFYYDRSDNSKL